MQDNTAMRIENHVLRTELLDIGQLTPLQGGLKTLSDENFNKLRQSLIEKGFQFTVHVWESGGVNYIIDGHQRVHVMQQLRKAGWEIPPITCAFVKASTYHEAKELILYSVSQFGKVDSGGFLEFTGGEDFDFGKFDFPDFNIDIHLADTFSVAEDTDTNNQQGKSQTEKLEGYLGSSIREIKLHFSNEEYEDVLAAFDELRREHGVSNNSELVKILLGIE